MSNKLPKLILLDIMLPGTDGISILKKIRSDAKTKNIPVIMITAKGTEYDKIIGLDSGADDYITKPFGMMELVSRIKAVLRRADTTDTEGEYAVGGLNLNTKGHTVTCEGRPVSLTLKEFELLRYLMQNKDIVLTRDMLLMNIWGYDFAGETRTVDVHIRTLRQKLGPCADMIETVRGVGYIIGSKK
jgi:two-component system alkaline phosphatase synthesis response regulator PhoP